MPITDYRLNTGKIQTAFKTSKYFLSCYSRAEEMVQQLVALNALTEDQNSVPSTHI